MALHDGNFLGLLGRDIPTGGWGGDLTPSKHVAPTPAPQSSYLDLWSVMTIGVADVINRLRLLTPHPDVVVSFGEFATEGQAGEIIVGGKAEQETAEQKQAELVVFRENLEQHLQYCASKGGQSRRVVVRTVTGRA